MILVVGDVVDDVMVQPHEPMDWTGEARAHISFSPGGSGANQAAWLGALGARVRFAGRVHSSDVERHTIELHRHGVDARLAGDPSASTGAIVVVVGPDGERDFYPDRGANLRLTELPDELLDGVTHLHVSGYAFFAPAPREAAIDLVRRARDRGISLSTDPSSAAFLRESGTFVACTRGMQVIFPNLDEGRALTGHHDPLAIAEALLDHYAVVTLKLGGGGALVATRGDSHLRQRARTVEVIDTTGAGDAFCAGFLARWAELPPGETDGGDLEDCLSAALDAAARAVSRLGARP